MIRAEDLQEAVASTLLELIQHDKPVQDALRQLLVNRGPVVDSSTVRAASNMLTPEHELLGWVCQDDDLRELWVRSEEPVDRQVVRLVAIVSQWDKVLLLWDRLAERCKSQQRGASPRESQILERCLHIHNLIWMGRAAQLHPVQLEVMFSPLHHQRGRLLGDVLKAQWLPGLSNAAGQLQRKPLVAT